MKDPKYNGMRAGKTDGRLFPVTEADVRRGAVVRMATPSDGSVPAFSDMVVLDVWDVDKAGTRLLEHEKEAIKPAGRRALLARPYAFASSVGGSVLTGVEHVQVDVKKLLADDSQFSAVVQSTGLVAEHLT